MHLFRDFFILNDELLVLGVQDEVSLVVEREGEKLYLLCHLVKVPFHFILPMLRAVTSVRGKFNGD